MSPSSSRPHVFLDIAPRDAVLRLVQLTDCHLSGESGGRLLGMDTDHSLQAVIDQLRRDDRQPDLVMVTGDLADEGAAAAYQRLRARVAELCPRQFWLPGNHDDRAAMLAAGEGLLPFALQAQNWQIIMLDSQIPGEIGGELGQVELAALDAALARAEQAGRYTLVCLHHHPVAVGCAWLDEQRVVDADALFDILGRYSGVKGLIWGHIHQVVEREWRGIRLLSSPSTCVQFAPGSEDFEADPQPPGYRWLELHPDGRLDTGVERVQGVHFELNLKQRGYLKKGR